ncbi:MAG TPA: Calx-beta domain-containing protein, partial [Solirubrobacteraceae bacterium]|nr:Calx-beta domain-containing protein [Solirubrobacteraceae bacterium]
MFEGETHGAALRERSRKLVTTTAALAATALAALLVCAGVASAQAQDNRPIRLWSFSELQQPAGNVRVAGASQVGGMRKKRFDFGSAAFNFPESDPRGVATGSIFSTASGKTYGVLAQAPSANPFQPGSPNGGGAHLDQLQAYEKRSDKASLRITITKAVIDAIDANHALLPSECPSHLDCKPIRGVVRFKARAYAESAGGDFFRAGGLAYIEGREGRWTIEAVTSSDSRRPLWDDGNFTIDDDVDDVGTRSHAVAELRKPVTMNVPLSSLRDGELFAVHVRLDAETLDRRGRESAVEAFIRDPQDLKPALIETTGLKARGAPAFDEPRVKTLPAARCPAGSRRKAGRLQLSAPAYVTDESTGVPLFVLVTRTGATRGQASATVRTSAGSAQAGRDYTQTSTTVRFTDGDTSPRLVEIPALQDDEPEPGQTFSVSLSHPHCATLGKQRRAEVTIVDDVALVRYTPNGDVDTSFGHSGITISDLGNDDFANAIALTAGGQIVAGHTLGSGG